jgi:hypothetical protein
MTPRPTVESALRLDIDTMMRWGGIRPGVHLAGEMGFNFYDDRLEIKFEFRVGDPWDSWLRLQYVIHDYWSGEPYEIDEKVFLVTSRPPFGGQRWWFMCPRLTEGCASCTCRLAAATFGRGAPIGLRMPPSGRLSMTGPCGALASCA